MAISWEFSGMLMGISWGDNGDNTWNGITRIKTWESNMAVKFHTRHQTCVFLFLIIIDVGKTMPSACHLHHPSVAILIGMVTLPRKSWVVYL